MKILRALVRKEFLQIIRDPSSIVISFVLPLISVLIFMYGINMDAVRVTIGIKNETLRKLRDLLHRLIKATTLTQLFLMI